MASKNSGRFSKNCGTSFLHSQWNIEPSQTIISRSKIKQEDISILDKNFKNKQYATTVCFCKGCVEFVKVNCTECGRDKPVCLEAEKVSTASIETQTEDYSLEDMSCCEREKLAFNLGKNESKAVSIDCKQMAAEYKDIETLKMLDFDVYRRKRNKVILAFLSGIAQNDIEIRNVAKQCIAVEQIYSLNSDIIAPISFVSNLLQYQTTQSRFGINLNSKMYPSASYPTVSNWLSAQGTAEVQFPRSDCMVAFDNDQVVGKTWFIKADNKVNASIITSVCAVEFDSYHQFNKDLHPRTWFKYEGLSEKLQQVRDRYGPAYDKVHDIHYENLYMNMNDILIRTFNEQKVSYHNGCFNDQVDTFIQMEELKRLEIQCALCGTTYKRSKIKCDICKVNLRECRKRNEDDFGNYEDDKSTSKKRKNKVKENEIKFEVSSECEIKKSSLKSETDRQINPVRVRALDPLPLNPNSYDSVKLVLRKIGVEAGVERYKSVTEEETKGRIWVFVMCDGLPYGLAHKLVHDSYYCDKCSDSVLGFESFKLHNTQKHTGEPFQIVYEFDWVVLLIGKGHYEMNMLKSFFELNWEPYFKHLAILMNFKTEKALYYAKACRDNHKAWQMLRIFYFGTLHELLVPYVRNCILLEEVPSVQGYVSWCKQCINPNYLYIHEQVLTYCQALMNYRKGIRTQNFDLLFSGKEMFANVFFGRSHSKYQYISLMETCDYFMYPEEIRSMVQVYCSFNTSVNESKGEDLDFKLEAINKKSKAWIKGVSDFETWLRVFRNLDKLDQLRKHFVQSVGLQSLSRSLFLTENEEDKNSEQILAWRCFLRKHKYLSQPKDKMELTSVTGNSLDQQLIKFTDLAHANRQLYFDKVISSGNLSESCKLKRVYVTKEERESDESIWNQKKEFIYAKILENILKLQDETLQDYYNSALNAARAQKTDLISLYAEIMLDLEDVSSNTVETMYPTEDASEFGD